MNPITVQDILEAGKHTSLTGSVLTVDGGHLLSTG